MLWGVVELYSAIRAFLVKFSSVRMNSQVLIRVNLMHVKEQTPFQEKSCYYSG